MKPAVRYCHQSHGWVSVSDVDGQVIAEPAADVAMQGDGVAGVKKSAIQTATLTAMIAPTTVRGA